MENEHKWCAELNCPRFLDGTCDNNKYSHENVCRMYNDVLMQGGVATTSSHGVYGYDNETLSKLRELGIVQCTSKLKNTNFAPLACMQTLQKKLFFMGVSGAKWVEDPSNAEQFKKMLNRVEVNNGEVRFLLIDPTCSDYMKMKKQREGAIGNNAYVVWKELVQQYSCLKVGCYTHVPSFRLQFMDDKLLAISRYQFIKEQYDKYNQGWDNPHLIIDSASEFSFYTVFERYFLEEWNDAKDILKITLQ